MSDKNTINVNIQIPKKLFDLIASMAENANAEFKTNLSAKDLVSRWVIQYFGTKNSLDIMAFSAQKYKEHFQDIKDDILQLFDDFHKTALQFDDISQKTNQLFQQVYEKLQNIEEKTP